MLQQRIGMIGAGRMATALANGLIRAGLVPPESLSAADPSAEAREQFVGATGARAVADNLEVATSADVVVLAVKPQNLTPVMTELCPYLNENTLVISIAAGVRLQSLAEGLGRNVRLVRVMPNTPCLVGHGASGYCLGQNATGADRALVEQLLASVGLTVEVDEPLLDAVTGLSGSGPAFVYLMIEALGDGGVRMGLAGELSVRLAAQTVRGAAEMVLATGEHPSVLRDRVTSPGGTTVAGLETLESAGFHAAIVAAVEAATKRSIELAAK